MTDALDALNGSIDSRRHRLLVQRFRIPKQLLTPFRQRESGTG